MATLQIDETQAKKLYPKANKDLKAMLIESFGKDFFLSKGKITDRVKSFEDACKELKINNHGDAFHVLKMKGRKLLSEIAISKCDDPSLRLMIIVCALNEKWTADWTNSDEYKYYPYFKSKGFGLGFAFSHAYYGGWDTSTYGGSRLCFKTRELAEYAGKTFIKEYNAFLM